jgi:DNA relaxase NicK
MQIALCHTLHFTLTGNLSHTEIKDIFKEFFNIDNPYLDICSGKGTSFYTQELAYKAPNNKKLISVLLNGYGDNANTTCFFIHGLAFEGSVHNPIELDLYHISKKIIEHRATVPLMHGALDSLGGLSYDKIRAASCVDVYQDRIVSRLVGKNRPPHGNGPLGSMKETIYYGTTRSKNYVRIYDKAHQTGTEFPWVRCEVVFKQKTDAKCVIARLATGEPLGKIIADYLYTMLDFKEPGTKHKRYRKTCKWWAVFLKDAQKLKLEELRNPGVKEKKPPAVSKAQQAKFVKDFLKMKELHPEQLAEILATANTVF